MPSRLYAASISSASAILIDPPTISPTPGMSRSQLSVNVAAAPSPKRVLLLAAAHALPVLPQRLHGPFTAYPA